MTAALLAVLIGHLFVQSPVAARAGSAPAPPVGTGAMSGTVIAADNSRPARRARVSLFGGDPRISATTTTGDNGEFSFTGLPPGDFTLSASKPGWLDSNFGQMSVGSGRPGTPIALAAGQHLEHIALPLARGGVLTGVVLDEHGEPTFGTPVRAMFYVMKGGDRQLVTAGLTTTDDRGIYRIAGLLPGNYIVAAVPRETDGPAAEERMVLEQVAAAKIAAANASGADMVQARQDIQKLVDSLAAASESAKAPSSGYAPVYYPGTTTGASAGVVSLGTSEEKPGIDVQLQIVPLTRVTGIVTTQDGSVPAGAQVMLLENGQGLPGAPSHTARVGSDGRFTFAGVLPGQYTLFARATVASAQAAALPQPMSAVAGPEMAALAKAALAGAASPNQLWAVADVSADPRNVTPVTLTMQPCMSITGALNFEGGPVPVDLSKVRLSLTPFGSGAAAEMAGSIRPVPLDADRKFTISGVVPGQYRISLASNVGLNGWSMKSAVAAGQDTLDLPLEIKPDESVSNVVVTMTTRATEFRGTLQGTNGQPAADYTVVVFSSDNRYWIPQSRRIQATRPSTDGRFAFRDLPPGDYRIAAVTDVEPGAWFAPEFLRQLLGASTVVTLGEGERKAQDVRIAR